MTKRNIVWTKNCRFTGQPSRFKKIAKNSIDWKITLHYTSINTIAVLVINKINFINQSAVPN